MKNIKHLLLLSILCSPLVFTNCGEDDVTASKVSLNVTVSPSEGGSVSPKVGSYDIGGTVEVTATPNTDYSFTGWTGDFEGSSNPVTLTMLTDQTLTANFEFQDADGDGVGDSVDNCAETASGKTVDENGCADSQKDTDGDGLTDDLDNCADTPEGASVDENGCADSQKDTDGDGVTDDKDTCADTPEGAKVDANGCADSQKDTDGDGVTDDLDNCPDTPEGALADENGCEIVDFDGPSVEYFIFEPTTIDITDGPQTVLVSFHVIDVVGVDNGPYIYIQNPDNVTGTQQGGNPELTSGDSKDGIWTKEIVIPSGLQPGEWDVFSNGWKDVKGNSSSFNNRPTQEKKTLTVVNN